MKRITALVVLTFVVSGARAQNTEPRETDAAMPEPLGYTVKLDTVLKEFDGTFCWFHPRAGAIPGAGKDGGPAVVITMQKWFLSASDYFSGLSVLRTDDMGKTWTPPDERPELAWRDEGNGVTVGICDFTPGWHAPTKRLLAIGHTVRYKNAHLMKDPRPRETGYTVYDPGKSTWQPWRELVMPDKERFFSAGAGCTQWLVEPDGTLLVPIYFKDDASPCTTATVVRCAFDGTELTYVTHGTELELDVPRGCGEPSLTFFQDRYYMTIRNDKKAYVTSGDDGQDFAPIKPWTFDDGEELGSYNTQQHWVTHSDGLFLSYTRRGADNDHVPRNRAPLFIAQVDPKKLCVLRDTERILIPERGAMMGNFGVATINESETWVTVGEGMYPPENHKLGGEGAVFAARVIWSKPNRLAGRVR
jgi:hypothetical protein